MYELEKRLIKERHPDFTNQEIFAYIMGFEECKKGLLEEAITLLQDAMHDIAYSHSCDICENHNDYDCRKQKGAKCRCQWRFVDKATKLIETLEQEG